MINEKLKMRRNMSMKSTFAFICFLPIFARIPSKIQRQIPNTLDTWSKVTCIIGKRVRRFVESEDDELSTRSIELIRTRIDIGSSTIGVRMLLITDINVFERNEKRKMAYQGGYLHFSYWYATKAQHLTDDYLNIK